MSRENRLAGEHSPYLLQHKHNPVDWYPWGEEAFEAAVQEDKPIFLSIGYSTCHWCHVMERECFEDEEVARLMNEAFISIKVDREERPDVDGIYMTVCQMMTQRGGWPLTIIMTPDKRPFYAGTYIPKQSRSGARMLGMMDLIPRIRQVWREHRQDVLDSAEHIVGLLNEETTVRSSGVVPDEDVLAIAFKSFQARFDKQHGGFGTAPKFPTPHNLLFLLRYWHRSAEAQALQMVEKTLEAMRSGGVFDQVGYGLHRYSTDAEWILPHFEKMLYDQALLAMAYTEAYQATRSPAYAQTAREIFTYVLRDMTSPEGGFYSAEDADSEGREGKFYVWHLDELYELLGKNEADLIVRAWNVEQSGNFHDEATRQKTGENILYPGQLLQDVARRLGVAEEELTTRLEASRQILFRHREQRVHPGKDDKILTDWNGLMIAALAKASKVFGDPEYARAAARAADFVLSTLRTPEGRLLHRFRNGEAGIQDNVDDYAFLIWGLLELYEATFQDDLLEEALALNETLLRHFWDETEGGFFFTPDDGERLLVRQKELYDGAVPSGNSVAFLNLVRLGRLTGNPAFEERADRLARFAAKQVRSMPSAYSAFLMGLDFFLGPTREVVIAGEPGAADTEALLDTIRAVYDPRMVLLLRPMNGLHDRLARLAPFVAAQEATNGKATAYVCRNYACNRPVTEPTELAALLSEP